MQIHLSPNISEAERQFVRQLPTLFDTDGEMLYQGRNTVKRFVIEGKPLIAKRFKKMDLLKKIELMLGGCKAKRAFTNAERLLSLGFKTPKPLGYLIDDSGYSYLVTQEDKGIPLLDGMNETEISADARANQKALGKEQTSLAEAFADYALSLHLAGIIHKDFNNTNIRFTRDESDGNYRFSLIDINRMKFHDSRPTLRVCLDNLHLFSECTDFYRAVLSRYLHQSSIFTQQLFESELDKKQQHDKRYAQKKAFTRKLKNCKWQ